MNDKLASINELAPIAKRMRDREERILHQRNKAIAEIGETVALIQEQGRDIVMAKTKLGKALRWSEWLENHVPTLPEALAARYERVATEQLSDPRQCVFAFLPPAEREPKPERTAPASWETAWGYVHKLTKVIRDEPITTWPAEQVAATRAEIEPLARLLWPERFAAA